MRNFARTKNASVEQELKRTICRWIELHGGYVRMYPSFRGTRRKDGSFAVYQSRYMPAGVPDLLACWRGQFIGIEVKRPEGAQLGVLGAKKQRKGVVSDAQQAELDAIKRALGTPIVAYSLDDVIRVLKPEALPRGDV